MTRVPFPDSDELRARYESFSGVALSTALRVLGTRSEAEDVVQETFVQIWREAARYDANRGGEMTWVALIARSRAIDRLRSRLARERAQVRSAESDPPAQPTPFDDAARRQQREHIVAALGALPRPQRGALELSYYEGLSHAEIALRLGTPVGTIKTWLRRGMAKMAKALRPHQADLRR